MPYFGARVGAEKITDLEPSCFILEPAGAQFAENDNDLFEFGGRIVPFGALRILLGSQQNSGTRFGAHLGPKKIPDLDASGLILEPVGAQFVQNGTDLFEFGGQIVPLKTSELC